MAAGCGENHRGVERGEAEGCSALKQRWDTWEELMG